METGYHVLSRQPDAIHRANVRRQSHSSINSIIPVPSHICRYLLLVSIYILDIPDKQIRTLNCCTPLLMPRTYGKSKGKAKQTRLSFVPTEFPNSQDEADNRNANVRYAHPSLSSLRSSRKASEKSSTPTPFVNLEPRPEETSQSTNDQSSRKRSRRKGKKGENVFPAPNPCVYGLI